MSGKTIHTDEWLAEKIRGGDENAFRSFYVKHGANLYHFAFDYLKSEYEAEEIVQNVFIRLWEKREEIDVEKSLKSYLFRIAVNMIFNQMKHQVVRKKYESYVSFLDQPLSDSPEKKVQYAEIMASLDNLLAILPEQQRKIFMMSRHDGFSNQEIAEKLEISIRTVENQIYRASKFIKENLKEDYIILVLILAGVYIQ